MLKLGAVPFLNVKPLVFPLEEGLVTHDYEIIYQSPSSLSDLLNENKVDLGLIPVAELLRHELYVVVPNISISSNGKVDSVVFLSKIPIKEAKTVAMDIRSQSSVALLRVILEIFNETFPKYIYKEPNGKFLNGVDAGLLIGDLGLHARYFPPIGYNVFDLGEIWTSETGLPFVYAVYAVADGVRLGKNLGALEMAKVMGLKLVKKISKIESQKNKLSEEICMNYLTERIYYDLGDREIDGIITFRDFIQQLDKNELIKDLQFYNE